MNEPTPLEPLTETWTTALCVVAHPDDMEFGAAAAVARWTGQGKHVVYCMVTSGEAGIDAVDPDECRVLREAEQVASARLVDVGDGLVLAARTSDPDIRQKVLAVTMGWAALNTVALVVDSRRNDDD